MDRQSECHKKIGWALMARLLNTVPSIALLHSPGPGISFAWCSVHSKSLFAVDSANFPPPRAAVGSWGCSRGPAARCPTDCKVEGRRRQRAAEILPPATPREAPLPVVVKAAGPWQRRVLGELLVPAVPPRFEIVVKRFPVRLGEPVE